MNARLRCSRATVEWLAARSRQREHSGEQFVVERREDLLGDVGRYGERATSTRRLSPRGREAARPLRTSATPIAALTGGRSERQRRRRPAATNRRPLRHSTGVVAREAGTVMPSAHAPNVVTPSQWGSAMVRIRGRAGGTNPGPVEWISSVCPMHGRRSESSGRLEFGPAYGGASTSSVRSQTQDTATALARRRARRREGSMLTLETCSAPWMSDALSDSPHAQRRRPSPASCARAVAIRWPVSCPSSRFERPASSVDGRRSRTP
jgi:hypothetical protein